MSEICPLCKQVHDGTACPTNLSAVPTVKYFDAEYLSSDGTLEDARAMIATLRGLLKAGIAENAENERLRAIVDKLPKTKDGMPGFAGDMAFVIEENGSICEGRFESDYSGRLGMRSGFMTKLGIWLDRFHPIAECYPTYEAAILALNSKDGADGSGR